MYLRNNNKSSAINARIRCFCQQQRRIKLAKTVHRCSARSVPHKTLQCGLGDFTFEEIFTKKETLDMQESDSSMLEYPLDEVFSIQ